ncbi:MAG: LysR family transcriptional regulator [Archangium sp.]|nr:LysR family transcriptional regulator [Archangium sp.]
MTTDIDPSDMMLFASVVREGGFSNAARRLGLSKQRVSLRIGRLEAALGVRLLERTTRKVRPTDAGARYVARCSAIAAEVKAANVEVRRQQLEPTGVLRISAPFLYGRRVLGPVVADFLKRWPQVRVELVLSNVRVDLVEEGFDLALRIGPLEDSSLVAQKVSEVRVLTVASPALLRRLGVPTRSTLAQFPTIGLRPDEAWPIDRRQVRVSPTLVVNDLELACEAAIRGVGLARLPEMVCGEAVARRRLTPVLNLSSDERRPVFAVMPSRRFVPLSVRRFLEALGEADVPVRGR